MNAAPVVDRERARRIMEKYDLDALIATAPENVTYLTEFGPALPPRINWYRRFYAILPRDPGQEIILVAPQTNLLYMLQAKPPVKDVRVFGSYYFQMGDESALTDEEKELIALRERTPEYPSSTAALLAAVSDLRLHGKVGLGVDEILITPSEWAALQHALPEARLVEAHAIFRELRMVKTAPEVERLRHVARLNEQFMLDAIELIHEGVEQRVIHEKLRQSMVMAGATPKPVIGFGWRSTYAAVAPSDYRIKKGDNFKFDHGCILNGYASDTARCGVIGQPDARQQLHYDVVREAQQVGIKSLRPGIRACDVFNLMMGVIQRGLKTTAFRRNNFGHGIGRDNYDAPYIAPDDETVLEAGMVLNIEAPDYEFGLGGFTVEDTVLLTNDDVEYFTHADRDLYIR